MKDTTTALPLKTTRKPGLFKRLVDRLDRSLKAKADEKAQASCCCDGSNPDKGKGGKCC